MGNLCNASENRSEYDTTEPSRKLKKLAQSALPSQVPEVDSNFDMDQVDNNSEVKIVVVGEATVGKTCAIQAYILERFVPKEGTLVPSTAPEGEVYDTYTPARAPRDDTYKKLK